MNNQLVAEVPASTLVLGGGAPVYERKYKEPAYFKEKDKFRIDQIPEPANLKQVAAIILGRHNIASKKWIYEQYDSMVGTKSMSTNNPTDAGIVNLKGTDKALALTVDCNARYVHADPEKGSAIAIAEAARNIVCSGGEPLAITNCLNFGNPYNPEVYWQFVGAIKGMSKACEKFNTPVTGGNVSFYNQGTLNGQPQPVFPTPTIGMLGIVENKEHITGLGFRNHDDLIYLLGQPRNDINCSEYLVAYHDVKLSPAPQFDLDEEYSVQEALKKLIRQGFVESAHDVSEGGLFVALFESARVNGLGFSVATYPGIRKDAFLFGESQSRIIVTVKASAGSTLEDQLTRDGIKFSLLGKVQGIEAVIDGVSFDTISKLDAIYEGVIPQMMA